LRDIPVFTTELGVASLILSQIPYTQKAYIHIQDSGKAELFLQECVSFCKSAGADAIYATGHKVCEGYPVYASILEMQADLAGIGDTDAALFPVTEATKEQWRNIYNKKITGIPGSAWMSFYQGKELLTDAYFIHRDHQLFGIGKASGDRIDWVASCAANAGAEIVRALCHALSSDTVNLQVASTNEKAICLYKRLGFLCTGVSTVWYHIA